MDQTIRQSLLSYIRKEFFALRNGMIADTLRKGGLEQKYIFGLQLPQIKEISVKFKQSEDDDTCLLAQELWNDRECREARLLACHLMPPSKLNANEAIEWAEDVSTREEADILAFRLLRYLPYASSIADTLASSDSDLKTYTATAIRRFL
ncbi:MAG: DNA alkylation repair protein [Muribaculaceae bacterium]|nr:DNA alkylation repair protein [Muribaculaceae bacterium]